MAGKEGGGLVAPASSQRLDFRPISNRNFPQNFFHPLNPTLSKAFGRKSLPLKKVFAIFLKK
jgi:hypothetical protein